MSILFENFVSARLNADILPTDTDIFVQAGQGDAFPIPAANEYCILVLEDVSGQREVVHLTARAGDTLTVTRGEEGTTPRDYTINDVVEVRVTSGFLRDFVDGGEYV